MSEAKPVRAFEVEVKHWRPKHSGIYAASTPAKARYKAWSAALDAGFSTLKFSDLRVRRAPDFDPIASKLKHGVDPDHARLLLQEVNQPTK